MNTLDERYADILPDTKDPGMECLVADLDRVCRAHPASAPPPQLRAAVAHVLHERATRATVDRSATDRERRPGRRTGRRHGLLAAAIVATAALVTGSALAAQSPINQLFADFFNNGDTAAPAQGRAPDETPPLGADVTIPQTVCGYTLTIRRLYADVNRVAVGYTFAGPPDRHFSSVGLYTPTTLADAHGPVGQEMTGFGDPIVGGVSNNVAVFDASAVATTTAPLVARLTIPTLHLYAATPLTAPQVCEHVGVRGPDPAHREAQSYPLTVTGPFTFDITAPVTTSVRTAEINQTVTSSHGTAVTLERVVVTPSEARVYVQGPPQNEIAGGESIAPTLYVGGKEIDSSIGMPLDGARRADSFGNWGVNLYQYHGEWTLKVLTDPVVRNYSRSWTDAVTFHFTLP